MTRKIKREGKGAKCGLEAWGSGCGGDGAPLGQSTEHSVNRCPGSPPQSQLERAESSARGKGKGLTPLKRP